MQRQPELDKLRSIISKGLTSAESLYKKEKYNDCLSLLNRVEFRVKQHVNLLADSVYELYDRRCLVLRRLGNPARAKADAFTMIKLKPTACKGYFCAAKLYEMEKNTSKALQVYSKGLEKIDPTDPTFTRFVNAYNSFCEIAKVKQGKDHTTHKRDPMLVLPYPDIFHHVLEMVPLQTVVACTQVSKLWRKIIRSDQNLWCQNMDLSVKFYKWKEGSELREVLQPAVGPSQTMKINFLKINRISPNSELPCLNFFSTNLSGRIRELDISLETLAVFSLFVTAPETLFSGLEVLTLTSTCSYEIIVDILNCIPSLKDLNVTYLSDRSPNWYLRELAMNRKQKHILPPSTSKIYPLERLSLKGLNNEGSQSRILTLIRTRTPLLKHLLVHYNQLSPLQAPGIHSLLETTLLQLESLSVRNDNKHTGYHLLSPMKSVHIRDTYFTNPPEIPAPRSKDFTTEELRVSHCTLGFSNPAQSYSHYFDHLLCGKNLLHLFLEFSSMQAIYSSDGYHLFISSRFPNLRTLSLGGNSGVKDETAKAIASSPRVPENVILSMTGTSDSGFDALVKAGVKKLGVQGCYIKNTSLLSYQEAGVKLLEYRRFQSAASIF